MAPALISIPAARHSKLAVRISDRTTF